MTSTPIHEMHLAPLTDEEIQSTTVAMAQRCHVETIRCAPGVVVVRGKATSDADGPSPFEATMFLAEVALLRCAEGLGRLHSLQGIDLTFPASPSAGWLLATACADTLDTAGTINFHVEVVFEGTNEAIARAQATSSKVSLQ